MSRQPGFVAAAVLTLALGIGATTAIFSVVKGVLIDPLPYPEHEALVRIVHSIGGIEQPYFSDVIYLTYAESGRVFEDIGVWSPGATATITGEGEPEEVRALLASRTVLTTLGVQPALGRWLSERDDTPGAPDAAVLTNGYWQRRFGGRADVLTRPLTVNGRPHQIVGVMPAQFQLGDEFEVILPLRIDRSAPDRSFRLLGVARLTPGVTIAQANADANRVLQVWFEQAKVNPAVRPRWAPLLRPLAHDVVGDVGRSLWVLMGAIAVVLLMACANVATLLLVRADARRHELAIRAALGASSLRIARHLLGESLALAIAGGVMGVGVAYLAVRLLIALEPAGLPRLDDIGIDLGVLGFALAVSLASGVLFGAIPSLRYARPHLRDAASVARGARHGPERQRSQHALVAAQVALALVLLIGAGLMIRSYQALRNVHPGFTAPQHVQTFSVSIPASTVADPERVVRMQHDLLDRLGALADVSSVAFTTRVPMGPDRSSAALTVEGRPDDGRTPANRQVKIVSPGLLRTLGTSLVAGREFTWSDVHDRHDVAIVSENLARELWGSPSAALGRRVREYYDASSPWREIVGVAGDSRDDGAHQPPPATVYWPAQADERLLGMSGYQSRRVTVAMRTTRAGTAALLGDMRSAVSSVSETLPLARVLTLDDVFDESLARTSFTLTMLGIAGTLALLLGVTGVYGILAFAVSRRRREIGVRLALGAQPHQIRGLFLRRGAILVLIGAVIGLAAAAGLTRLIGSELFGITPLDPPTFVAATLVLLAAAMVASDLPARRAVHVDPVETIRAE